MVQKMLLTTYRIGVSIGKTCCCENKKRLGARRKQRQQKNLNKDDNRDIS